MKNSHMSFATRRLQTLGPPFQDASESLVAKRPPPRGWGTFYTSAHSHMKPQRFSKLTVLMSNREGLRGQNSNRCRD